MPETMTYTGVLVVETCCACGISFAVPKDYQTRRRDDHELFYCPAGHSQHYTGMSEAERLRRDLKWANESKKSWMEAAESTRRSLAATKGVLTRTKNRIAAGICPCCKKEFKVLAKHMANAHPEYAAEPDA